MEIAWIYKYASQSLDIQQNEIISKAHAFDSH